MTALIDIMVYYTPWELIYRIGERLWATWNYMEFGTAL